MRIAAMKSYRGSARSVDMPTTADKALGIVLTSLLAVYAGASRFDLAMHVQSRPFTYGLLLLWLIKKGIELGKNHWRSVVECVQQVDDVVMRVSSIHAMTRIKSSVSASSMRLMELATGEREIGRGGGPLVEIRSPKISVPVPFFALEKTADLTLSDLKDLVRFAVDINRLDFNKKAFLAKLLEPCRVAADAIDHVLLASRGHRTAISTSPIREDSSAVGDMDALAFIALVRIFAEWRSVRLVPDGHQRYAVGMVLAKRDLIQNAQKIENAVHSWMADNESNRNTVVGMANGRQVSILERFLCMNGLYSLNFSNCLACSHRVRLLGISWFGKGSKTYTLDFPA
jgi:hypothetical protein